MATYNNLASLEGLQVGDVITYDTTTAIDFKGYKVKVELYGKSLGSEWSSSRQGGYTVFNIDTSILSAKILSFNNDDSRNDLIYGNNNDLYYRIAVAGNAGTQAQAQYGGSGGGLTGQNRPIQRLLFWQIFGDRRNSNFWWNRSIPREIW